MKPKHKLLVIDDDDGVRQSLVMYLEDSGFEVYEAANGVVGWALFQASPPDLVVTDLCMPDIDGLALLQRISDASPNTPVIVISGAGVMGDVVRALRFGAADYLIKPFVDLEVLVLAIDKSLERCRLVLDNQRYRQELEKANQQLKSYISVLEQDQKAGHFVQQSMLPPSPFFAASYLCEHRLIPSLYLSGDCIDYVFNKERYCAFYLADVSGHGSAPAFVTIWLKHLVAQLVRLKRAIAAFSSESESLVKLLQLINGELLNMGVSNHLTMVVGILDTQTGMLYYIVAGHLPLPVVFSQNQAHFLEGKGKPIGLFQTAQWTVHHYQVPQTDDFSLILFSDGVLELLSGQTLKEKEQQLLHHVTQAQGKLSSLSQGLEIDSVTELPDDVAMLAIRRVPDLC